jgi:hypothetical protein
MNFYTSIIIFYLCSSFSLTFNSPCTINDYKSTFTECSNNTRNIIFSYKTNCSTTQSENNLPLSITNTPCKSCNKGEFLTYNVNTLSQECKKCPANTYSTGSSFQIRGEYFEWNNQQLFSSLTNECYVIDKIEDNNNCKGFTIEQNGMYIKSNNGYNMNNYDYIASFYKQVELVSKGKIEFKYKKDTNVDNFYRNGLFRFYVNYLIEVEDLNPKNNNKWITVVIHLEPGKYSFLWQYYKKVYSDLSTKMSLYISDILIDGTETSSLTCIQCENGISGTGSDHCNYCDKTKYFDKVTNTCIDCPQGKVSKPFSSGIESCVKIPPCTKDNYYRKTSKKCNAYTNKQQVQYELIENNCIENGSSGITRETSVGCNKCLPGQYIKKIDDTYTKCEYCPGGSYSNKENANSCATCEGWIGNVMYITPDEPKKYKGEIDIAETTGEMIITYSLINKTISESGIDIEIDGKSVMAKNTNTKINLQLTKGMHSINIKTENAILERITFKNTVHGGGEICKACSIGFMVQEGDDLVCKNCGIGMELNSKNECQKCPEGYVKNSNDHYEKCKACPKLTRSNDRRTLCLPQQVITNYPFKQKFILSNYEKYQNDLCKFTNNLCSGSFYGPIKESNANIRNANQSNLYFISFSQPNQFENEDFTYKYKEEISQSFIYLLQNEQNSKNNTKVLTSLGKEIDYIQMILTSQKKGVVIKYSNGDTCDENESQKYETILFLNCTKEKNELINLHAPKFITKNKCVFYFEWASNKGCPLCRASQVDMFKLYCRNFNRDIYYIENDYCIIDSTEGLSTNPNKEEMLNDMLEYILTNNKDNISEIYNINFDDNERIEKPPENDFYIEHQKRTEACYLYDDFDKEILIIVITVPIIYILILVLCIYFWCKYRRLRGDYHRLLEEPVSSLETDQQKNEQNNLPFQQIELGSMQGNSINNEDKSNQK